MFAIFVSVLSSYIAFADTTNVYDPAGRLVQVITTGGTSVTYVYDAGGNLKQTVPSAAGTVVIATYSPPSAAPGSSITINGSGFSTTAAQNVVTIGGVAATVTAATANTLTVTVPTAVANGQVSVTVTGVAMASAPMLFIAGASLAIDGASLPFRFVNGQTVSVQFAGTAGQRATLGITGYSGTIASGLSTDHAAPSREFL